jgi:hypothetical protein
VNESVAITKEADAKKSFSPTRNRDESIHRYQTEPEQQLGSLRGVIGDIRRDGSTPWEHCNATERNAYRTACTRSFGTSANSWQPVCTASCGGDSGKTGGRAVRGQVLAGGGPGRGCSDANGGAAGAQRQPEEGVELIQTKSLTEQITPLAQRQVGEEEAFQRSLKEPEPPLSSITPRAAGPPASTTPSPECALACGSTYQMTSPEARVSPYRAEIVRGISG